MKKANNNKLSRVFVVDNMGGQYFTVAKQLTKHFSQVFYYSINQSAFPVPALSKIGTGYEGITRVDDFWSNLNLSELFVIPDVFMNDIGAHLRSLGKKVFGGTESEILETDRRLFHETLDRVGCSVVNTAYLDGVNKLKSYLRTHKDRYIKVSAYRGAMETFEAINYAHSEVWLNELQHKLGMLGDEMQFIAQDGIDAIAETGFDGYNILGQYPSINCYGVEIKDAGYLGKFCKTTEMPKQIQETNARFNSALKSYKHQGWFSSELRIKKSGEPFFIDPTMRCPSPPGNCIMAATNNLGELIQAGAEGKILDPEYDIGRPYVAEIILRSNYALDNYLPITIPSEFEDKVFIRCSFNKNGQQVVIPSESVGFVGSAIGQGSTPQEAMEQAIEAAKSVEAYDISFDSTAPARAFEQILALEKVSQVRF